MQQLLPGLVPVMAQSSDRVPSQKQNQNPTLERTVICSFFQQGKCMRGSACKFAHSKDEVREKPDLLRTSLCNTFMKKGFCKNGKQCKYAHGEAELRLPTKATQGKATTSASAAAAASKRTAQAAQPVVQAQCRQGQPASTQPVEARCKRGLAWDPLGLSETDDSGLAVMFHLMQSIVPGRVKDKDNSEADKRGQPNSKKLQNKALKTQNTSIPLYVKNTFLEFDQFPEMDSEWVRFTSAP
eukprot:TRINITY_DN75851_c0_g1_i1.p1 TRINITY_DN75851_c0_g1~~TRINITY_DN75851_c0_g1_i1.p1  ORF type:complete len:241 (-),score=64.53 TRINITY_DN75851_c0_g1_i1:52-774(-)